MNDRLLKLLLIDQDPIFRLGLRVALEQIPDLQIVSEAETDTGGLQTLAELTQSEAVNLVVLELGHSRSTYSQQIGLQLCQQIKAQYPSLPILLLSSVQDPGMLTAARNMGVDGYCPKGTPIAEIVTAIREVATGHFYWNVETKTVGETTLPYPPHHTHLQQFRIRPYLATLLDSWRLSGVNHIDTALAEVTAQLQVPGLPILNRAFLVGHRRELLAARRLLNVLLTAPNPQKPESTSGMPNILSLQIPSPVNTVPQGSPTTPDIPPLLSPRALQATLFASCINKLQFPLKNLTETPLEIDILQLAKKRELLYIVLQKVADILDEMRASQVGVHQLPELRDTLLLDMWRSATTDFFGKFSRIKLDHNSIEIVPVLLQNPLLIQTEILQRIPLVIELFSYLLFQNDLLIDNTLYAADSFEAREQGSMILENLLIQVANAVIQPLLNYFADLETIKQNFYDHHLISTREVERFRNNLSWKYRVRNYVAEPKAIFESRYELFIFTPRGLAIISVYAPRGMELAQLTGVPLFVTLLLELRDAIAPRLQSLLSLLGNAVVFVLTQVVGRGLGLIARGILQGIGSATLPERSWRRSDEKKNNHNS